MNNDNSGDSSAAQTAPAADTTPSTRNELIEHYRKSALRKADPLAANLAMIASDLMVLAGGSADSVTQWLARSESSPEPYGQFERRVLLHLRVVRQVDQLARLERQQDD